MHGTRSPPGSGLSLAGVGRELCLDLSFGLTEAVLPRARAVVAVKQVSNEDEFHQLCTGVTHQH